MPRRHRVHDRSARAARRCGADPFARGGRRRGLVPSRRCQRADADHATGRAPMWSRRARLPSPSRNSGCFSSASSGTGATPPSAVSVTSRANTPAGVSGQCIAAGIVHRHAPAPERGKHPPRQRPVGRDQRSRLVWVLDAPRAATTAIASASSSALAASTTVKEFRRAGDMRVEIVARELVLPQVGRRRGAQRFRRHPLAAMWSGSASTVTASRPISRRRSNPCMANCGWPEAGSR